MATECPGFAGHAADGPEGRTGPDAKGRAAHGPAAGARHVGGASPDSQVLPRSWPGPPAPGLRGAEVREKGLNLLSVP
ncbi:hypothetical protein GCM10027074_70770 [Streptomyces deserti]